MIIVRLMGGMGNQMFQFSLGRSLSILNKTDLILDSHFLLNRDIPTNPIQYFIDCLIPRLKYKSLSNTY